jgi:hypothetical protein
MTCRWGRLQIYYSQADQDVVPPEYKGRLSLPPSHGTGGNVSIGISNMQTADSGLYTCEVRNSPDIGGKTEASIVVQVLGEFVHSLRLVHLV